MSVAGVLGFALAVFVLWWVWSRWKEVTRQQDTPFEPAVEHFNYEYEHLHILCVLCGEWPRALCVRVCTSHERCSVWAVQCAILVGCCCVVAA